MKLGVRLKVLLHSTPLDSLFMVEVSRIESFIDVGNAVVIWLPRLIYGPIYGSQGSCDAPRAVQLPHGKNNHFIY
jgi:hypothetical protein